MASFDYTEHVIVKFAFITVTIQILVYVYSRGKSELNACI